VSSKVKSVSVRLATEEEANTLHRYTNSSLIAMNTCPTWAIVKDQMRLGYENTGRAMALEAGAAMHEMFAAVRLWQLWRYDSVDCVDREGLILFHGKRLFGEDRFQDMMDLVGTGEDDRTLCLNFCLQALYSSGFYDDPSDNRRTMSNLEEAAIMYIDRWDFNRYPIWIRDKNDPESDVGIEIKFDVIIEYEFEDGSFKKYLYSGTLDGLQINPKHAELFIGENKTASRLDEAWRQSFEMSSQITGYALAATVFAEQPVSRGVVWGVQIPLPKSYDYGGLVVEHVTRESFKTERWFDWFLYTVEQYERFKNDPHNAPKFTHSCNRYFRPCSMIPFCASDDEEQKLALSEMIVLEDRYSTDKAGD
jgi:hypothetical protein